MPILAPGLITSYDIPENAVDISPEFYGLKLPNTTLYNMLGIGKPAASTDIKWYDDVLLPTSTTLSGAYSANDGHFDLTDSSFFRVGSVVKCESSLYRVSAVNQDTKVATIVVLSGDANHASGKTVEIVGNGQLEGKAFANAATQTRVERLNYCQIFDETAEVSGTEDAVKLVNGSVGKMSDEIAKKLPYLALQLARSVWNGAALSASDNTTPRLMGGVKSFITANGYCPAGATFNHTNFDAFLLELANRGGNLVEIWCNPAVASKFSALKDDSVVADRSDATVGRFVRTYLSGHGYSLSVNADPACLDTDAIYVFPSSNLFLRTLRPMQVQDIAKVGDANRKLIVGEYSLEVRNSQTFGKFTISG